MIAAGVFLLIDRRLDWSEKQAICFGYGRLVFGTASQEGFPGAGTT